MRNVLVLVLGLALLVAQTSLSVLVPTHPVTPNLLLPIVMYLGVAPDVSLARGGLLSFMLGYALDEFCGAPMGLATTVLVATYLVAHGAVHQLLLRGTAFQIALTFVVGLLSGGSMLALRAIFGPPEAFPLRMPPGGWLEGVVGALGAGRGDDAPRIGSALEIALTLAGSSLVTALLSPFVFAIVRRIEAGVGRGRRDAEGAAA